jgi:hypothetical protein
MLVIAVDTIDMNTLPQSMIAYVREQHAAKFRVEKRRSILRGPHNVEPGSDVRHDGDGAYARVVM